ncbi:MAG TPA: protein-glutamate O-methyltransferase CheR [Lacipirellula sp.]
MTSVTIPPDAISFVCSFVRDRSAIELEPSKSYLIEARLGPLAKQHGYASPTELIQGVRTRRRPDLEHQLVEAMTTNETSFFRDKHPYDALREHVIPELIKAKSAQRTLSIWSAACSTGQELYSVAMLLREHFPELSSWNVQLVGTDLSDDVLAQARAGRYNQIEVNRGLPATLLVKYFHREGMSWRLSPDLTAAATFLKMNLVQPWPALPKFDVVFLRNVLIYFGTDAKKAILQKVRGAMTPKGYLSLGAAETTMGLDATFEREQVGSSVFYRSP